MRMDDSESLLIWNHRQLQHFSCRCWLAPTSERERLTLPKGGVDHCANLRAVQTSGIRILFESEPNKNDCAGTRTQNMLVKSRLLYQLSYAISNEQWYRDLPLGFLRFFGNILGLS